MSGAIHPLPQYAFMAWCLVKSTGTTLPFTFMKALISLLSKEQSRDRVTGLEAELFVLTSSVTYIVSTIAYNAR
jgi:hypothetical protein